ncbi:RES family NAD+ phosphorylase [Aquiflexum sp.]|uniref:RES family NAD+ phosphorylase n=1 Tax=Aquiflexum sp. TaxID=1872584 RepID=UPI00359443ED
MKVYRIALTQYCDTSGEGAKRYGGRWNLPGVPALYGGSSVSSSLLERLTIDSEFFASERYVLYSIMEIDIPDKLVVVPKMGELPNDWNSIPPKSASQEYGTELLQNGLLCFGVPSVVDQTSLNYVVNPLSEKFHLVTYKVYSLRLDERIGR